MAKGSQGRVLLVEDDSLQGSLIKKRLESFGLHVCWETSEEAALKKLETEHFHAAICDIYLQPQSSENSESKQSGLRLVRRCSDMDLPTIVMTCQPDLEIASTSLNSGAYHFFTKPFQVDDLYKALVKAWEEPRHLTALRERFFDKNELTPREREIGRLVLKGFQNKEIAEITKTSMATTKFHLKSIFSKCTVRNRSDLFNSIFPS